MVSFKKTAAAIALLAAPVFANAQMVNADPTNSFGGRVTVGAEIKVAKHLTASIDEELRFGNSTKSYTTAGLDWKAADWLKLGAGYTYIYKKDDTRHRLFLDLTESYETGNWTFSLRERAQMTHRNKDINTWQNPRNLVETRVRFKVAYKASKSLKPYALVEEKNTINAVKYTTTAASSMSYSDIYVNRVRGGLGLEWKVAKKQTLDIYGYYDYGFKKEIDAGRNSGKLKTITRQPSNGIILGVSYRIKL